MKWGRAKIYFLATQDRSMIKIGCSNMPADRLATFAVWSPVVLELLASAPGWHYDERALHNRFLPQHSHLEWFHASPELLALIDEIGRTGAIPKAYRGKRGEPNLISQQKSIRATPEWRARMSEIHTARCAIEKASRALIKQAVAFCSERSLTVDQFNKLARKEILQRRQHDGSIFCYASAEDSLRRTLEKFSHPEAA